MKAVVLLLLFYLAIGIVHSKHIKDQVKIENKSDKNEKSSRNTIGDNAGTIDYKKRNENLLERLGYTHNFDILEATDMETLMKQKFLLEVLFNVNGALVNKELQELGETLVLDEQRYVGGFDAEMLQLFELCLNNRMLSKKEKFSALNSAHVRQMMGFYKLLVRAIDWETFQRNVCFGRMHLNGELLVNALLLAINERQDTTDLITPGLHEILPELFYNKDLLQRARDQITLKPQLMDLIKPYSAGRRLQTPKTWQEWRQEGMTKHYTGGVMTQLLPSNEHRGMMQSKKPYQQWRQERLEKQALYEKSKDEEKAPTGRLVLAANSADNDDFDKRISYLTHDVGLNNFWYNFNLDTLHRMSTFSSAEIVENKKQMTEIDKSKDKVETPVGDRTQSNRLLYINRRRLAQKQRSAQTVQSQDQENINMRDEVNTKADIKSKKNEVKNLAADIFKLYKFIMNEGSFQTDGKRFNTENSSYINEFNKESRTHQRVSDNEYKNIEKHKAIDIFDVIKDLSQIYTNNERLLKAQQQKLDQDPSRKPSAIEENDYNTHRNFSEQKNAEEVTQLRGQNNNEERKKFADNMIPIKQESSASNIAQTNPINERLLKINRRRLYQMEHQMSTEKAVTYKEPDQRVYDKERLVKVNRRRRLQYDSEGISKNSGQSNQGSSILTNKEGVKKNTEPKLNFEKTESILTNMGKLYKNMLEVQKTHNIQLDSEERKSGSSLEEHDSNIDKQNISGSEEMNSSDILKTIAKLGRRRLPRSISNQDSNSRRNFDLKEQRAGEIVLTTLQQMMVRLKMERYTNIIERKTTKDKTVTDTNEVKFLNEMNEIEQIIRLIFDIELAKLNSTPNVNIMEVMGQVFMGRQNKLGKNLLQLLTWIFETYKLESDFTKQLSSPFSYLMERVLNLIDAYTYELDGYDSADLLLEGVKLNDVKLVDKLQTYFDTTDGDLINLMLEQNEMEPKDLKNVPVAQQRRLNHKPFMLNFDITNESGAPRPVVIRIFLGPKLNDSGRVATLDENRRNFLLLDAFSTELPMGRNTIKRKSMDISWTSKDSVSFMKMYKEVMLAIDGKSNLQLKNLFAENCRFPQRLLLPRGLAKGLPMQLFAIVTPVTAEDAQLQRASGKDNADAICGMGTAAITLDKLPLTFPLDRSISNSKRIDVKNAILKNVMIYHQADKI